MKMTERGRQAIYSAGWKSNCYSAKTYSPPQDISVTEQLSTHISGDGIN